MYRRFPCLIFLLLSLSALGQTLAPDRATLLQRLDSILDEAERLDRAKEERIATLRSSISRAHQPSEQYPLLIRLYDEYRSYQYDSAYAYANRSMEAARLMHNAEYELEAGCAKVFCQSSSGLFKEAFDTFEGITLRPEMAAPYRTLYFETGAFLNFSICDYNQTAPYQQRYVSQGSAFTDSLLLLLPANSPEHWMAVGRRQMKEMNYPASLASFERFLSHPNLDEHQRAIALSSIGWMLWQQGKMDEGFIYMGEAAMADVRSTTKETTALCGLAELLYKQGDVHRATRYVQLALEAANFYNARQRKIEVGNILPIIEESRNADLYRQRNVFIAGAVICLLLTAIIAYLLTQSIRKSKKLREANRLVEQSNAQLGERNQELKEANKIKAEYIGSSLYSNVMYMEAMEKMHQMVSRKLAAGLYDELKRNLQQSSLKKERGLLFANFDKTFLRIFPHFIQEYNQLFAPEDQRDQKADEPLNTEMRIFALIRLGINDSESIARFLDKSVHTIHTYKTRVKNKSLVKNEDFEARIMQIDAQ